MIKTIIRSISLDKIKYKENHKSRNNYLQWEVIFSLLNQPSRAIIVHYPHNNVSFNQLYQQPCPLETIPSRSSLNLSQVLENIHICHARFHILMMSHVDGSKRWFKQLWMWELQKKTIHKVSYLKYFP